MKKEVKLRIISERYELCDAPVASPPEPEMTELFTEAVMQTAGKHTEISYAESELSGLENSHTRLIFERDEPETLTVIRTGSVGVTMVFSPGLRHECKYKTPVMPFDMVIITRSVSNRLFETGKLDIDYSTTIIGAGRARTRLTIELCGK